MKNGKPLNCIFLKHLMEKRGYTNRSLSEKMGVSTTTISKWRTGKKSPCAESLNDLADALGVDSYILLEDDMQKTHEYLRLTLYKSMDLGIEPVNIQTLMLIMKTLGLHVMPDQKITVESSKDRQPTDAELDILRKLANGLSQSEATEDSKSES